MPSIKGLKLQYSPGWDRLYLKVVSELTSSYVSLPTKHVWKRKWLSKRQCSAEVLRGLHRLTC